MAYPMVWANSVNFPLWILVLIAFLTYVAFGRKRRSNLPPGPRGLPIVGYLPFLGEDPHLELTRLSKKYGDIFGLYLGTTYVVVVADYAAAKELLNKPSTADRPPKIFQFMTDGVGMEEVNGQEWVEQRRYTVHKLKDLGFGRSHFEKMVQIEVRMLLDLVSEWDGQPMDIDKPLSASISNNVLSLLSGHSVPMGDPRRDIIDRGVEAFETMYDQSGLVSLYPSIFKFAVNLGLIKAGNKLKDLAEFNKYVRQNVAESKQVDDESYICQYWREIEKHNSGSYFNVTNLIGNVQAIILAGSDTTKVSLQWLFLAMASCPDVQDKVHQEIDSVMGKEEPSGWVDRLRLTYCHATIMEGQRWRTVVPLNLLHRVNSDTTIRDYVIPKGSNVMALLWAFHNDERHWNDPETFRPERFLDQDGKVITKMENYAPFACGKRICIGETVANIELFFYFVGVMQRFRILPESNSNPPNLRGYLGLTFHPPKQPLRYVPR